MQKPTVNIYHDVRRPLVSGLFPVKIRVALHQKLYFDFKLLDVNTQNRKIENDIFKTFQTQIHNKTENGEIGTANSCKDSLGSFKKFWKSDYLSVEDVDVKFLKRYEKWMLEMTSKTKNYRIGLQKTKIN